MNCSETGVSFTPVQVVLFAFSAARTMSLGVSGTSTTVPANAFVNSCTHSLLVCAADVEQSVLALSVPHT